MIAIPSRSGTLALLLLAACTGCSSNLRTGTDDGTDRLPSDPQSAGICDSLRASINKRSSALLRRDAGVPLPLPAYKFYVDQFQPRVLALISLEEQLYGIWRIPTDKGLCQSTMAVLEHPREAAEVSRYLRAHDLDSPTARLYDEEFQNLGKSSDEEIEYVNNLVAFWDHLSDLGERRAMLRKEIPMIGINTSTQKEAAELFSSLQAQLDAINGELPAFGQRSIADALNGTSR